MACCVTLSFLLGACAESPREQSGNAPRTLSYDSLDAFWAPHRELLEAAQATDGRAVAIPLWPDGAPGFEERQDWPEEAKHYWVKNVHAPSLLAYLPPKEKATGMAMILCPGGGYRELVIDIEGNEPAKALRAEGVAAFVLKYRLAPYQMDIHGKDDAQRAVRVVRALPETFGIDPQKVGMLGFSAGGSVASQIACETLPGDSQAVDPLERLAGQPNAIVLAYPGIRGFPSRIPADAPPAFLVAADNDPFAIQNVTTLQQRYTEAKVPHRLMRFPDAGHGFAFGQRTEDGELQAWPKEMLTWLQSLTLPTRP